MSHLSNFRVYFINADLIQNVESLPFLTNKEFKNLSNYYTSLSDFEYGMNTEEHFLNTFLSESYIRIININNDD